MAQFNHRINLLNRNFPLLSSELGRTVLISNNRNTPTGEKSNEPEILYCHNVMPTVKGVQSVGFNSVVAALTGGSASVKFSNTFIAYAKDVASISDSLVQYYVAVTDELSNKVYIYNTEGIGVWKDLGTFVAFDGVARIAATVNGESYIMLAASSSIYQIDNATQLFTTTALIAPPISVFGIIGAKGYMIAWSAENEIAWSSLINPLDFAPSAITGAGTGKVEECKGRILCCVPNSTGFLIYAQHNVVAALYTGNKQYPFKLTAIENSPGLEKDRAFSGTDDTDRLTDFIAWDDDSYGQYTFTKRGLFYITPKKAEVILPEVSDFMNQLKVEDYDTTTDILSITTAPTTRGTRKRLALIAARYLVISYGVTELTHALIYDLVYERLGKIKLTHIQAMAFDEEINSIRDNSAISFMLTTGEIKRVVFDQDNLDAESEGVLLLGKYQYHRDRHLVLQGVTVENVNAADTFEFIDKVSLDGRNTTDVVGTETAGTTGYREFKLMSSGKNHTLAFIGQFMLSTIELLFSIGGRR